MKIDTLTWNVARNILEAMEKMGAVAGKNPYGYIAAAIYIASILVKKKRTQRELAEVARITEATIRTRCKEIVEKLWITLTV
jgi:transcription initiation factor TFIIB